jgi:hypothetical protein
MTRLSALAALCIAAALVFAPAPTFAQQKAASVKAGKGEKVCRVKMKFSGENKTWVCKKEEPCCVWHEINYVKCGSTVTGCL